MINLRIGTVDIYLRIKQKVFQGQVTLCVSDALWSWRSLRSQKKTPGRRRNFVCATLKDDGENGDERKWRESTGRQKKKMFATLYLLPVILTPSSIYISTARVIFFRTNCWYYIKYFPPFSAAAVGRECGGFRWRELKLDPASFFCCCTGNRKGNKLKTK